MTSKGDGTQLTVGIVGVGNISETYLRNLTTTYSESIEVRGCADVISRRSAEAAERWNLPNTYASVEDLLGDPEVEAVVVLTNPVSHFDVCLQAVRAGKHVYVEKPICATPAQARALLKEANSRGVLLSSAPDTCLGSAQQRSLSVLKSGMIGEPVAGNAFMLCHGHERWHPNPGFFYAAGAGPLMDMGPYYLTAMIGMMGSVVSVQGSAQKTFPQREIQSQPLQGSTIQVDVPTHIVGVLSFERGALATIVTSFDVWHSQTPHLEVHGTLGSLSVPDPNRFAGSVRVRRADDEHWEDLSPPDDEEVDLRGLGVIDLAQAIQQGIAPRLSGALGLHVLEVMAAIEESAQLGSSVTIESRAPERSLLLSDT
jgi:predicted dehydrogenase